MYDVHFLPNVSLIVKVEAPTVIEEAETHEEQDDTMNERSMSEEMTNEEDEDEEVEEANNLAEDYVSYIEERFERPNTKQNVNIGWYGS